MRSLTVQKGHPVLKKWGQLFCATEEGKNGRQPPDITRNVLSELCYLELPDVPFQIFCHSVLVARFHSNHKYQHLNDYAQTDLLQFYEPICFSAWLHLLFTALGAFSFVSVNSLPSPTAHSLAGVLAIPSCIMLDLPINYMHI